MYYERILAAAAAQPWAIEPTKGRAIAAFLSRKARGEQIPEAEVEAAKAAKREGKTSRPAKNVALVPVYGTIMQRADWMMEYSGGTSADELGLLVEQLAADPRVDVIVLDIDSPGGSAFGLEELSGKLLKARDQKKIIGMVNSMAASAAYWIAAACTEVVVTPGGMAGSIGVYMMHVDHSKELEQAGRVVTLVSAGEFKTSGNPYEPLGDAARSSLQAMVNGYYEAFVKGVATGRGTTPAKVKSGFGRGDVVLAKEAVAEGMADRVATLDEVLARFGVSRSGVDPAADASGRTDVEVRRRRLLLG